MQYELVRQINAASVTRYHDAALRPATALAAPYGAFAAVWQKIEDDHRCNALLWIEEDKARRMDAGDAYVAACKRRIDRYTEQRCRALQSIDARLLDLFPRQARHGAARLHSESAGAMIDRLSVLALRIHHARAHALHELAGHRAQGKTELASLVEQRIDLARCFDELIAGVVLGIVYFKVYSVRPTTYAAGTLRTRGSGRARRDAVLRILN